MITFACRKLKVEARQVGAVVLAFGSAKLAGGGIVQEDVSGQAVGEPLQAAGLNAFIGLYPLGVLSIRHDGRCLQIGLAANL